MLSKAAFTYSCEDGTPSLYSSLVSIPRNSIESSIRLETSEHRSVWTCNPVGARAGDSQLKMGTFIF